MTVHLGLSEPANGAGSTSGGSIHVLRVTCGAVSVVAVDDPGTPGTTQDAGWPRTRTRQACVPDKEVLRWLA